MQLVVFIFLRILRRVQRVSVRSPFGNSLFLMNKPGRFIHQLDRVLPFGGKDLTEIIDTSGVHLWNSWLRLILLFLINCAKLTVESGL